MSKSVNVKFAKCFIIFMAIVILVQGVAYIGLALWGITRYNCDGDNSDPLNRPLEFAVDLIYFSSEKCTPPTLSIPEGNLTVQLQIDYNVAEVISYREFIFLVTYIVISALWIITSFFVLVTICVNPKKGAAAIIFWLWFILIILGSMFDAVATGYHVHDIIHTTTAEGALEYVGVKYDELVLRYLADYDILFAVPGVIFTCISCRILFFWLLNIFGAIFCLTLSTKLSTNISDDSSVNSREWQNSRTETTSIPKQHQRVLPATDDTQRQNIQQQDQQRTSLQKDQRNMEPLNSQKEQSPSPELITPYALPISRQQSTTKNKRVNELKTQASTTTDTPTYQISDAHPTNLDYPNHRLSINTSQQASTRSATPELSAISPLNMRYSTTEGFPFQSQPHISQELRGQLPWSYTNIMNDPIAQKRIQAHLQPDDEDFPPIPVPDYTLHPPKKERETVSQDRLSQTGYSRW